MSPDDPRDLVERARAGDRAAMDALVERYGPLVRSALGGTLAPDVHARVDTDDLFQSTMTAALADLKGFTWRDEPSFRAWLLAVARREAAMSARFHRRQARSPAREGGEPASQVGQPNPTTASARAVRRESTRQLEDAVKGLPAEERSVIELHSVRGLSFAETARLAGLPGEDAARHLYRKALKRLGERMNDAGD